MESERKASNFSRSPVVPMRNAKVGGRAKKSRHAVETSEQKTAGPKPRKRAVNSTAASSSTKRRRCKTGEKVQRLNATHTASKAPAYCTGAEWRFFAIQLFKLSPILDICRTLAVQFGHSDEARGTAFDAKRNFSSRSDARQPA